MLYMVKLTTRQKLAVAIIFVALTSQIILQASCELIWNTQLVDQKGSGGSIALDSNGNPHIVYSKWYTVTSEPGFEYAALSLKYAVWTGTSWNIKTVDPSGSGGQLALDSTGAPHIIYTGDEGALKYAVLSVFGNWDIKTIDNSGTDYHSMVLDSKGNAHVVYTVRDYSKNQEADYIKYAILNGATWDVETIDTVNVTATSYTPPSIAVDPSNNPHIIYLETIEFQNPIKTPMMSFYETSNVKYAFLNSSGWQVQTAFSNATSTLGNLVLDSKGQPSFCLMQEFFTYNSESNNFNVTSSMNYAYFNGSVWNTRVIDSEPTPSGQTFLNLDSSDNPQLYFYAKTYQKSTSILSLMNAQWTGSNWNTQNLGNITSNQNFYNDSPSISDIAFDSQGKPSLTYDGETGTFGSAPHYGGLTYASLESIVVPIYVSLFPTISALIGVVVIATILLVIYKRKHKNAKYSVSK
jgi:hypothetical protein